MPIKAHFIKESHCCNDHIEVALEWEIEETSLIYFLTLPLTHRVHMDPIIPMTSKKLPKYDDSYLYELGSTQIIMPSGIKISKNKLDSWRDDIHFTLEIDTDFCEIVRDWEIKSECYCYCTNNCADFVESFLNDYTDVPPLAACEKVTCDRTLLWCYLPSFLQCCSVPERVLSRADGRLGRRRKSSRNAVYDADLEVYRVEHSVDTQVEDLSEHTQVEGLSSTQLDILSSSRGADVW